MSAKHRYLHLSLIAVLYSLLGCSSHWNENTLDVKPNFMLTFMYLIEIGTQLDLLSWDRLNIIQNFSRKS